MVEGVGETSDYNVKELTRKTFEAAGELCQEAGAQKVRIADNTIHDVRRCFALTGAGMVAKISDPRLIRPPGSLPEESFLDLCQRCGLCMKVCPTNAINPTLQKQVWLVSGRPISS